jgi:UDP-glucose 4-epimerase
MRTLVTGGAGFIGSHLVEALIARGDSVVVLDDFSTGSRENLASVESQVEIVEGSILDADLVDDCMRSVDTCLHLASAVGVKLLMAQPLESLQTNVRGNDIVIGAGARHGRRLLFTSTSEVYGRNTNGPLSESADGVFGSPFKARWAYAISKSFGEALAFAHHRDGGSDMVVTRLFNVVGPRQTGAYGMVLPRFVRQALAGEPLTIYGNGVQSRCFTHVHDVVGALLLLLDSPRATGRVFNVGSSDELPIIELARRVVEQAGSGSDVEFVPYQEAYGEGFEELWRRKPDISLLQQLTGWEPQLDIEQAIDDVIAYERGARVDTRSMRFAR